MAWSDGRKVELCRYNAVVFALGKAGRLEAARAIFDEAHPPASRLVTLRVVC